MAAVPQESSGTAPKRAGGAPRRNGNARTHDIYSLQRRLKNAGLRKNDGRSGIERIKADWKNEIRPARGGDLSPQQEVLLELAANTWLMASSADDYILEHGVINRWNRGPKPQPTLDDIMAQYARKDAAGAQDEPDAVTHETGSTSE